MRYFRYLLMAPVAVLMLIFAYANRAWVTVSFDPLESADLSGFVLPAPLFAVVFVAIMIGVIAGGSSTWFSQARHRRALRQARGEIDKLRSELQATKVVAASPMRDVRRA